jgi:nitrogenase molybdenum-iron protein alpha/beta subunit
MSARKDPTWDLEHFRLKSLDLGQLTGAAMAMHAMPDAFLLKHTGVGCKHKTVTQFGTHDWGRGVAAHEGWTEVGDAALIRGSGERVGPYARSAFQRHTPGLMGVVSVTFLDLTGDDLKDRVEALDQELDCDVVHLRVPGFEGDLFSGYLTCVVEVARRFDWSKPPDQPAEVCLLGYLWDRYEGDHQGNQLQIKGMLQGIGLSLGPVLFSGVAYTELKAAPRAGTLIALPYAAPKHKALQRITRRTIGAAELPIGLRGSTAFLRAVGRAAGVADGRITAFTQRQEQQIRERMGTMVDRLRGLRVAVFADLPLLVGVVSLLDELGMSVVIAGIRGRTLGGRAALAAALERLGAAIPEGCEVLEDPSLAAVREAVGSRLRSRALDGVLGSATDHNVISTIPASDLLAPYAGEQLHAAGPFRLEIGFPCKEHHCAFPMPFMGYGGVLMWLQRLLSAPRTWDAGRSTRV